MKHQISPRTLRAMAAVTMLAISGMAVVAQDSTTPKTAPAASPASTTAPASVGPAVQQLSFGVPEVLKLSQAKINEDTIIAYIQNSAAIYAGMNASEIVYLHEQGVSDRVVTTMLNRRKQWMDAAAPTSAPPATVTPAATPAAYSVANTVQYPPQVTYVQSAPVSSVYVIPNTPRYVDYGYYPSYGYYGYSGYGYSYPAVSLSFGFGGGYRGGGYYGGGYRGGGYHGGGGFHGGGSPGGGGHHR